ncbi:MAG: hypothetical protein NUV77_13590 [Thermoguttaceae bacterium]|nr:hypothetical protein [Thermoguttaceae bacterium]
MAGEPTGPGASHPANSPAGTPPFAIRELYAPGHFGNSYEVLGEHEMRAVLAEAVYWGFNRYGDWFDMEDCSDPFAEKQLVLLSHALWERKKAHFRSAQALGLACDLIITPNHVYVDQCAPSLLAKKGGRVFGQLICPSKPEARAVILRNYENLFADLARAGVRLAALCPCPYDFGGCNCDACKPWILTYARLVREIHALAERSHPGIEMRMIGWWWTEEEHRQLAEWVDRESPGWIQSLFLHIPYGKTGVANVPLPKGCRRQAFVHIGYADLASPRDIYGHLGPVIAAERLPRTLADLAGANVTGLMAYSEGVFDDVNKALLAGLGSGKFRAADEVLSTYAQRYFGADVQTARAWAAWLKTWGRPFDVAPADSARQLADLLKKTGPPQDHWRRRQWELKLELFRLHAAIAQGKEWTPNRLQLADQFWAVQEQIHRGLWGLAPQRHIFDRRFTPVPWYAAWAKAMSQRAGQLGKEQ